jgi:hypothetical protein
MMGDLRSLLADTVQIVRPMQGGAVAYLPPGDPAAMGMGQTIFRGVSIYHTRDAKGYSEKFAKMFDGYNHFFQQMQELAAQEQGQGQGQGPPPQMNFTATFTPNVMQIEGVTVDQYQTQVQYPPEVMAEMGPMMPWMMMLGATGQTNDDHLFVPQQIHPMIPFQPHPFSL